MPHLHNELLSGDDGKTESEVVHHQDAQTLRGIALTPTEGLLRGSLVVDCVRPLVVPVGRKLLGIALNVCAETIGRGKQINGVERRSIHQALVPLTRQDTQTDMFHTGIQLIDALAPLERTANGP